MSDKTGISWTDATWNPVRGCSRVSEGCRHCYAERVAARFSAPGQPYDGLIRLGRRIERRTKVHRNGSIEGQVRSVNDPHWTGDIRLVPEHLADPLRWRRPRRIFVNSMSDLFHESLTDDKIDQVYATMLLAHRHTYQVLTKRAARMRRYFAAPDLYERILRAANKIREQRPELNQVGISHPAAYPARWIWLGVSVENQAAADERIPDLLATPAALRFLSCEPLLSPVNLTQWLNSATLSFDDAPLDWVIAGCESGPGARPADVEWFRSLRDQCAAAGVPFFLKQAVETSDSPFDVDSQGRAHGVTCGTGSKRKQGGVVELPYLDGVKHDAFPG